MLFPETDLKWWGTQDIFWVPRMSDFILSGRNQKFSNANSYLDSLNQEFSYFEKISKRVGLKNIRWDSVSPEVAYRFFCDSFQVGDLKRISKNKRFELFGLNKSVGHTEKIALESPNNLQFISVWEKCFTVCYSKKTDLLVPSFLNDDNRVKSLILGHAYVSNQNKISLLSSSNSQLNLEPLTLDPAFKLANFQTQLDPCEFTLTDQTDLNTLCERRQLLSFDHPNLTATQEEQLQHSKSRYISHLVRFLKLTYFQSSSFYLLFLSFDCS